MFPSTPDHLGRVTATIRPHVDIRHHGSRPTFDPRSYYAETFWLPILGPSTLWFLRKVAERFDTEPNGFELDLIEASLSLGIPSKGGRNNPFGRAIKRVVSFKMGETIDEQTIAIVRTMPPLHSGQVRRLTPRLANLHDQTMRSHRATSDEDLHRATNVAHTLLCLGDSREVVRQQLLSWGVASPIALKATAVAHATRADQQTNSAVSAS